jgi:hypothetical protein
MFLGDSICTAELRGAQLRVTAWASSAVLPLNWPLAVGWMIPAGPSRSAPEEVAGVSQIVNLRG